MFKRFFALDEDFTPKEKGVIEISGITAIVLIWWAVVEVSGLPRKLFPSPLDVATSIPELYVDDGLVWHIWFSLKINILGYLEAIAVALPLGFVIGLFAGSRAMFERPMSASRFMPLPAITGLCIVWFGMGTNMKVQFLALAIFVYLLPLVVQRVIEVQKVYIDTVKTLGATKWQIVWSVHIPDVTARVYRDIVVMIAISWTYITVVETINMGQGGIGALCQMSARADRPDKTFALLLIIAFIGIVQDKILVWVDKKVFKFKYA